MPLVSLGSRENLWNYMQSILLLNGYELSQPIEQILPLRAQGTNHFGCEQGFVRFSDSVIGIAEQEEGIGIGSARFLQILDGF